MLGKFLLLFFIFATSFSKILSYEEDEYYCRSNDDYKICNRCKTLKEDCQPQTNSPEEGCKCDNIALYHQTAG